MTAWGVLLVVLALDVLGITAALWLARHDRLAQRLQRAGDRFGIFAVVLLLVLPPLWLLLLVVWWTRGVAIGWSLLGPLAVSQVVPLTAGDWVVVGAVTLALLAAMAAFPLRPRWWSACLTSVGLTVWLFLGLVIVGSGV